MMMNLEECSLITTGQGSLRDMRLTSICRRLLFEGYFCKLHASEATGLPPSDYDLEARYYVEDILRQNPGHNILKGAGITTLTSDYGLYWFDYLGGYDILLAQFGWNHSTVQDIALAKGAARLQNKLWGAIITWKYESPRILTAEMQYMGKWCKLMRREQATL